MIDRDRLRREIEDALEEENANWLREDLERYWQETGLCLQTLLPPLARSLEGIVETLADEHLGRRRTGRIDLPIDRVLDFGLACMLDGFGSGVLWRHNTDVKTLPTCQHADEPPPPPPSRRLRRKISPAPPDEERPQRRRRRLGRLDPQGRQEHQE
ncbi:MAG: hypothetical protein HY331_15575 [Chloroflexi bacterium]|nr:hypothetical protein [Chloroflexota bacterium]